MPVSTDPPAGDNAVAVVPGQGAKHAVGNSGGGRNSKAPTVDSHTAALGVIQPPPDVRAIVDKTAQFVARNGEWNERKKRERERERERERKRESFFFNRISIDSRRRSPSFLDLLQNLPRLFLRAQDPRQRAQQRQIRLPSSRRPLSCVLQGESKGLRRGEEAG